MWEMQCLFGTRRGTNNSLESKVRSFCDAILRCCSACSRHVIARLGFDIIEEAVIYRWWKLTLINKDRPSPFGNRACKQPLVPIHMCCHKNGQPRHFNLHRPLPSLSTSRKFMSVANARVCTHKIRDQKTSICLW